MIWWFFVENMVLPFLVPKVSDPTRGRDLIYGTGGQMGNFSEALRWCFFLIKHFLWKSWHQKWEVCFCFFLPIWRRKVSTSKKKKVLLELPWKICFWFGRGSLSHPNILQAHSLRSKELQRLKNKEIQVKNPADCIFQLIMNLPSRLQDLCHPPRLGSSMPGGMADPVTLEVKV